MARPPHLVLIVADQLRWDFVGSFMPRVSELMRDSRVFERAYCASPLCVPARGALYTGLYPNQTGSLINPWFRPDVAHGRVRADYRTLYETLADTHDTWHAGKQHTYCEPALTERCGPRVHWRDMGGYSQSLRQRGVASPGGAAYRDSMVEWSRSHGSMRRRYSIPATGVYEPGLDDFFDGYIARQCLDAIQQHDTGRPLALLANFLAPHPPLQIPQPYFALVKAEQIELPVTVGQWCSGQSPLQLYHLPGIVGSRYRREDWREVWRVYAGLVRLLDDQVGRILDALAERRMLDESLIVFTADHGEMLGSHSLWQKMCNYEEAIRVPLVIRPPGGVSDGRRHIAANVSHVDLVPTLCELMGIDVPNRNLPGQSLAAAVHEGREPPGRPVFVQFDGNGTLGNASRAVIEGSLKLNIDFFQAETFFELYDLATDPLEQHNLALRRPEDARRLLTLLTGHMTATGDLLAVGPNDYQRWLDTAPARLADGTGGE